MKNIILFITIVMLLSACRSAQQIADKKCAKAQSRYELSAYKWGCPMVQRTDSIVITKTIRETHDTTIFVTIPGDVQHDTVTVKLRDGIVQSAKLRKDTRYAYASAQVIDGVLVLELVQKESVIASTIKDAIQKESGTKYITVVKTVVKQTNVLKSWQAALMWMGGILSLLFVLGSALYLILKRGKLL